jgi:hypothetical protein
MRALVFGSFSIAVMAGCTLDPLVSDEIDLARVFGDPSLAPEEAPHVEDNPDYRDQLSLFPSAVPYLRGYVKGERVWYWRIDQEVPDFIVPYYVLEFKDGTQQRAIVDVIPGEGGYSPWWRKIIVRTTDKYTNEKIWSRDAIDAGVKLGILEEPEDTTTIITAPIVRRDVRIKIDPMNWNAEAEPSWGWYRNQRVSWIIFDADVEVPNGVRLMPRAPVYVLRRVNELMPLNEHASGVDLDGDGRIVTSNNIFPVTVGELGYTPMWYPVLVKTVEDYVSIDNTGPGVEPGLTAESQFLGADYSVVISPLVVPPLQMRRELTELCPIQRTPGRF